MSSDKKASTRGKVIISRLLTEDNKAIAQKYRKLNGYPEVGFFNLDAYEKWKTKHPKNKKDYFPSFLHELLRSNPDLSNVIDTGDFYSVFTDLYLFAHVQTASVEALGGTGCEWLVVTKDDVKADKKIKEGVYIKINIDSNISNIKKFLDQKKQKKTFEYLTDLVRYKGDYQPKSSRFRHTPSADSYHEMLHLQKASADDLSKLSGLNKALKKDEHIAVIMSKKGRSIKAGSVRKNLPKYKGKTREL